MRETATRTAASLRVCSTNTARCAPSKRCARDPSCDWQTPTAPVRTHSDPDSARSAAQGRSPVCARPPARRTDTPSHPPQGASCRTLQCTENFAQVLSVLQLDLRAAAVRQRHTNGHRQTPTGLLDLHCSGLSPPTLCRSPGAPATTLTRGDRPRANSARRSATAFALGQAVQFPEARRDGPGYQCSRAPHPTLRLQPRQLGAAQEPGGRDH